MKLVSILLTVTAVGAASTGNNVRDSSRKLNYGDSGYQNNYSGGNWNSPTPKPKPPPPKPKPTPKPNSSGWSDDSWGSGGGNWGTTSQKSAVHSASNAAKGATCAGLAVFAVYAAAQARKKCSKEAENEEALASEENLDDAYVNESHAAHSDDVSTIIPVRLPSAQNELPEWRSAIDPASGKQYYFVKGSKLTTWEKPNRVRSSLN